VAPARPAAGLEELREIDAGLSRMSRVPTLTLAQDAAADEVLGRDPLPLRRPWAPHRSRPPVAPHYSSASSTS
jgi:hypothetical protein